jgi:cytosine/adenosine deaminase-related metal-dependent hydrolase/ubiquinone/menaquinone biosynthesis C-methylase UbiE
MKTLSEAINQAQVQSEVNVFDCWAQVYDIQPNPLLMLEERKVAPLLPSVSGLDILDVGCGTGRWLVKLELLEPTSLKGTDCSPAMLARARLKVRPTTIVENRHSSELPGEDASYSLVLASFVLSYLNDVAGFARQCARVLRADGCLLLSDMHPATAAERGWSRSFHSGGDRIEITAQSRTLTEVVSIFGECGFEVSVLIEPSFEEPERPVFDDAGKLLEYEDLAGVPAIYILKLKKTRPRSPSLCPAPSTPLQLTNVQMSVGPDTWRDGVIRIEEGRISSICDQADAKEQALDLSGYVLLPGLINAHDHLDFGLFPNLGRTLGAPPYQNCKQWAWEINRVHSAIIKRYKQIPKTTRLWWGAIRNLLSGVTTVCHHNPLHEDLTHPDFPVRVLSSFGWAHSLAFDPQLKAMFWQTPADQPFVVHAAEGIDAGSRNEIAQLDRMQVLDERTVLIHGLACTTAQISLINGRGASLVVCPTSNRFLFAKTLSRDLIASVERVSLGSDSPLTAAGDLLDEVSYLSDRMGLNADAIYRMVTSSPAEMLHLTNGEGQIVGSGVADLIAIRSRQGTPALVLAGLTYRDVELVLLAGRVQMVSGALYARLPQSLRAGLSLLEVAGHRRWVRSPAQTLVETAESALGQCKLLLGKREVRYLAAI